MRDLEARASASEPTDVEARAGAGERHDVEVRAGAGERHGAVALRVVRIHPRAALPRYASEGAAGLDLSAALDEPMAVAPLARVKVPTGLVVALPLGHEGQVRPRSGLAIKCGLTVLNAPGTIDEDYRGELAVLLVNLSQETVTIAPGDRIAQLVVSPVTRATVLELTAVDDLGATSRGAGGFGSTGRE